MAVSSASLKKLSAESSESVTSSLDLFSTPHTHTSIVWRESVPCQPVRQSTSGQLEFEIPESNTHYLDLDRIQIALKVRVKKQDGTNLQAAVNDVLLALGDNFMHSLFATATLKINGQDVEYEPNYAHRAYLENLINYGKDAKDTHLWASSGWLVDSAKGKDYENLTADERTARKTKLIESGEISFFGRIRLSVLAQQRLLPPGMRLSLILQRSTPKFCLLAEAENPVGGGKVEITDSKLFVERVTVNPALQRAQAKQMTMHHARVKLPINRVKTSFHVIPAGVGETHIPLGDNGQKPKRVIVGFVDHAAKTGDYRKNPFKFAPHHVKGVQLRFNGVPVAEKFSPDFTNHSYARTYGEMIEGVSMGQASGGNGVSYEDFGSTCALYVFDKTGDPCSKGDNGFEFVGNASLTLQVEFSEHNTETISVFVYQERDDMITLDNEQNVALVGGIL